MKKPPFRFLHDVVSEVQRNTGYASDLFDAREKSSANVRDKDAKVAYLTKIIACVAIDSGARGTIAMPLKIVAGAEPERTNAFLQVLARCAAKGDGREAARRARLGETGANDGDAKRDEAKDAAVAASPARVPDGLIAPFDPFAEETDATRANARAAEPAGSSLAPAKNDVALPTRVAGSPRPPRVRRPPPKTKPPANATALPADAARAARAVVDTRDGEIAGEEDSDSSDAGVGDGDGLDEDPPGANPGSAARTASWLPSRAGGALVRDMLAAKREGDASVRARAADAGGADAGDGGGGGIILGSRRRRKTAAAAAEARVDDESSLTLGEDVFWDVHPSDTVGADAPHADSGRSKASEEDASLDLGAARDVVQALVRSTNPLGRAMDALAEDAESMRAELRFWRRERVKHARRVKKAREEREKGSGDENARDAPSAADDASARTEAEIARVAEKIEAARMDVVANDATIARLLAMVVTPSSN